ncbi:hypothetical protein [Paracoccus sp. Ld10]|uniref:hypothetical protein n=1 Tax=Paracoccus sp. Ld10 TaxID=649158 RepID=UPI00386EA9F0
MKAPRPAMTPINFPYRTLFPAPPKPSPSEEEAAAFQACIEDLVAVLIKHGMLVEVGEDEGCPVMLLVPSDPVPGALVVFHDGEMRFEGDMRDPEDVVAQVAWNNSNHGRLAAAKRVGSLSGKKDREGVL